MQNEQLFMHARVVSARIARFQNCYGPEGTWTGGREKAPAALCRKVAESTDGTIDVWVTVRRSQFHLRHRLS